ncbi:MAG: ABC transporter ATP-binding protein [Acidobacteria bacterium]|nr:ABC transporter ATP-binding protein [Acidobacteriota bacterium]
MRDHGRHGNGSQCGDAAPCALLVDSVSKQYVRRSLWSRRPSPGAFALSDVSFSVRRGEVLGVLGPNGAGKTTLLKIISTMLYPDSGRLELFGHDLLGRPEEARRMIGLVTSDERSFYWRLNGRQNLAFFAALYGVPKKVANARITALLETLGLAEAADRGFHGYSSGMKQKIAIARGLLADPRLILYDEPTRALDPLSAHNIRQWIIRKRAQAPEQTHLVATNLLNEAEELCDRVLIINHGAVIALGTIQEIREQWNRRNLVAHRITCRGLVPEGTLAPVPEAGLFEVARIGSDGDTVTFRVHTEASGEALSDVLRAVLACGAKVVRCESEEVSFDEVFCSMVLQTPKEQEATAVR